MTFGSLASSAKVETSTEGGTAMNKTIFAGVAICAYAFVFAASFALPFLKPDFHIQINWISDYSVGRFGWLQKASFISAALGAAALIIGLRLAGPKSWLCGLGVCFLAVCVPGLVVSALFDTDLPGQPQTQHGVIHLISAGANFLAILLAEILISSSFGDDTRWRPFRALATILTLLVVVGLVAQFATADAPFSGIVNRAFAAMAMLWLFLTSVWLFRLPEIA